ncbi:hypothetical protein JVT61DRAFT_1191 [Boletus reticuloceps]|uniref:Uncharacterized protein n=1 Tax=Boletus reticuloceps TaxID=495285 RepID=A0A8I2YQ19_9AGAM|nr:hypothetical protein JVT61DRAFT_1191 [Boletus reticuloceps]
MGKSAKLHKRKKTTSSSAPQPKSIAPSVQSAKKRADLKSKAKGRSSSKGDVLGGADYVTLMLGGRRKAADEALKLPPES